MHIVDQLRERARVINARIVLPEGDDPRVQAAAAEMAAGGVIRPILLSNNPNELPSLPSAINIVSPNKDSHRSEIAQHYFELRKHKGVTLKQAHEAVSQPLTYAAMMLRLGMAEGCVAGAVHATSDVLRAGLQLIGMAEDKTIASSAFLMILPDGRALTYGDCGMVPNPNAKQLAAIAQASAHTHRQLTEQAPVVAMLSFSTKGSAVHPDVDKVRTATAFAQADAPDLAIDGELQFDAAWVASIGESKAPGSPVAGKANVFIFPTLDAGNIAYKITERLGNAQAIGPIIQGLAKPIHDLSRGCSSEDIITLSMIAAIQSNTGTDSYE